MEKTEFNFQINTWAGYIDNEISEKPLIHQINRPIEVDEEEEILLPLGITLEED